MAADDGVAAAAATEATVPGFERALLHAGLLARVLAHLRLADMGSLARTSRALHAFMRDATFVWADLVREWRLPLVPEHATFARVGALLRLGHLQLVPVAAAAYFPRVGDEHAPTPIVPLPPPTRAGRRTAVTLALNLDALGVSFRRVPAPASRLPRRSSVLGSAPPPPAAAAGGGGAAVVLQRPATFDKVLVWRNVRGWVLDPRRGTLRVVFRPDDRSPAHGHLLLADTVPHLRLLVRLFTVYTELGCLWATPGPLVR